MDTSADECSTHITHSPCKSPASECMRVGGHLDLNYNTDSSEDHQAGNSMDRIFFGVLHRCYGFRAENNAWHIAGTEKIHV